MRKTLVYFILMIVTMGAIFVFSSDNGKDTNQKSNMLVDPIESTIKATSDKTFESEKEETDYWKKVRSKISTAVRKTAHTVIYCLLSIFALLFFKSLNLETTDALMMTLLLCVLYAAGDELHQHFSNGRDCKFSDVCIDTFGAWIGTLLVYIAGKIKAHKTKRKLHFKAKL